MPSPRRSSPGTAAAAAATLLLAAALFTVASARFVVEKSGVKVLAPPELRGHHEAAIANFGVPNYGGTMIGVVVYSTDACKPFASQFHSPSARPVVLLVDRGDCVFALKTWNAQNAGAAAVLVADNVDEPLLTMDTPEDAAASASYVENITIPSVLVTRDFGAALKKAAAAAASGEVVVRLDWRESMPHPDDRVEYEFWTNSNDECGARCDEQTAFVSHFRGHAQLLEKAGFTLFTPHYITWYCPDSFLLSKQCKSQCINRGRYCAPDPDGDFDSGYEGRDIVIENLRQLCVHRIANTHGRPWVWWDYVLDYHVRCSMKGKNYSRSCAEEVVKSLGLPFGDIMKCIGDPDADKENDVLKTEQALQAGHGTRGDVTILPTIVINNVQYRGRLESTAVLKAICAGFKELTEPPVCLNPALETNECHENNGGCWKDKNSNITACRDTFRGRICQCPLAKGVQYHGDGYKVCEAMGHGKCSVNNGGCWKGTRDGKTFSACSETSSANCSCPSGFEGNGHKCTDIDECSEKLACFCPECSCTNTWGGYECKCNGNYAYLSDEDTCVSKSPPKFVLIMPIVLLMIVVSAAAAAFIFYKYRFRAYMDSEIMAIMSQYVPIDKQNLDEYLVPEDKSEDV